MVLKETERTAIENLRTQEKSCIEKYQKYAQQAIDPELKNLFEQLHKKEQTHYDSLTQVLDGTVPSSDCNDSDGRNYEPRAIYTAASQSEDKMHDAFLATDAIGTEKLVSGEYNNLPGILHYSAALLFFPFFHFLFLRKFPVCHRPSQIPENHLS